MGTMRDTADAQSPNGLPDNVALSLSMLFNGATFDRARTPNVFKTLSAVVITAETTIWTPAAGKKFRLMGFLLTQGVVTGAASTETLTGFVFGTEE